MITRRAALHIAALAGPILIVQGFRLLSGVTPPSAEAATPHTDPLQAALAAAPRAAPTPAQAAAIDWLAAHPLQVSGSPMNHRELPRSSETVTRPVDPDRPEPPAMTVTSVFGGAGGLVATINNQARRIGDELAGGWTVSDIDLNSRSVLVQHPSGATARAYLSELGRNQN